MSSQYPALRCQIGKFEYYLLAIKAGELVEKVKMPSELEGWANLTLQERQQRDMNLGRVKKQIAPYLAKDPRRFFGSIIVLATQADDQRIPPQFERMSKIIPCIPVPYCYDADNIGYLTFFGREQFVSIDGQHRVKALKYAIDGRDDNGKEIPNMSCNTEVAGDHVSIIMLTDLSVPDQRKIFTSVNKYAKRTTTGQNLVTDDDDVVAVISSYLTNELFTARLVNYKSNTLTEKDHYFITLATIAECIEAQLEFVSGNKIDREKLPDLSELTDWQKICEDFWGKALKNISLFSENMQDKTERGDDDRKKAKEECILLRPVGIKICIQTVLGLIYSSDVPEGEAFDLINQVDWTFESKLWEHLIIAAGKIQLKNTDLAINVLKFYLKGSAGLPTTLTPDVLLDQYRKVFPNEQRSEISLPRLATPTAQG